jgi:hypothetical protein
MASLILIPEYKSRKGQREKLSWVMSPPKPELTSWKVWSYVALQNQPELSYRDSAVVPQST